MAKADDRRSIDWLKLFAERYGRVQEVIDQGQIDNATVIDRRYK